MISDAPYKTGELVMKPVTGILGGLVGAMLMMGSMKLMEPISDNSLPGVLRIFGSHFPLVTSLAGKTETGQTAAGAGLLILGGCLFGLFYALSEQRIPARGLIADGLFYGFILWVFCGIILGSFLGDEIRAILRSWAFLIHTLSYGICLAMFAVSTKRSRSSSPAPRD